MKRMMLLLAVYAFSALMMRAQAPGPPAPPPDVLIKPGLLLDVRTGHSLPGHLIWIHAGKIAAVGTVAEVQRQVPAGVRVIDLSQYTVMPGLIDCHTHLTDSPYLLGPAGLHVSVPRAALLGARNARVTLEAGFTTVRNVGADGYADVALRDAINAGDVPGPRMLVSGPPLSITGGHADENFLAPEFNFSSDGVVDGVDAVIHKVRENIKYGADLIKIMATGGVLSEGDNPELEQLSPEEMQVAVTTAHGLGRKVAAHAHGALGIKNAVLAGVDSIEHGSFIDETDIQLMKQRGTYLVPTLYLGDWFLENAASLGVSEGVIAKAKIVMPAAREHLAVAFKEGVRVAFGTDAAVYPHGLNAHEFAVMVKLGLTPLQAIQAATVNAADLLGWQDRVGTIEKGHFADIIAVEGDPQSDVTILQNVKFVMKGGEVIKQ
jgi:imidazolonepropionase-like amidohydrolase